MSLNIYRFFVSSNYCATNFGPVAMETSILKKNKYTSDRYWIWQEPLLLREQFLVVVGFVCLFVCFTILVYLHILIFYLLLNYRYHRGRI